MLPDKEKKIGLNYDLIKQVCLQATGSFVSAGLRQINAHLSDTISCISGCLDRDDPENIFSPFVSLIGCSSGLHVFQMPCEGIAVTVICYHLMNGVTQKGK